MKSVLLRLYDGEICPAEQFGLKQRNIVPCGKLNTNTMKILLKN